MFLVSHQILLIKKVVMRDKISNINCMYLKFEYKYGINLFIHIMNL